MVNPSPHKRDNSAPTAVTMKLALLILVLVPLAFAKPEKRLLLDTLGSLIEIDKVKCFLQYLVDLGDADETEHACEATCHSWIHADEAHLIHTFCAPVCLSAQALIHTFDITPDNVGPSVAPNSLHC